MLLLTAKATREIVDAFKAVEEAFKANTEARKALSEALKDPIDEMKKEHTKETDGQKPEDV